jgi:O-antigen ligase
MNIRTKYKKAWDTYTLFTLCSIAFCVSLGAATVSLSKLILLIGFLVQIVIDREKIFQVNLSKIPTVFIWMIAAVAWSLISMTWSDATVLEKWKYFYSHSRFLWLGVIYYLLMTKDRALVALKWLIYGQIFVVAISWLMSFGFEVPFTRRPLEEGIAFTSTLDQPVMTVLALILLWGFRDYWIKLWGDWFLRLIIVAMLLNIVFVMSGRTGYIVLLISIAIEAYRLLKGRWRLLAFLSPIILTLVFFTISPTFSKGMLEIPKNTQSYLENKVQTSEGERLEMWRGSIYGILKKPILGYGIGSTPDVYKENGGMIKTPVSQPHQQYLFWWVEFGFIGLMIMLGFFIALMKDSSTINNEARNTLHSTIAALIIVGMFNCPFFGVGMGELFFLQIAAILRIRGVMKLPQALSRTRFRLVLN